ncbi:hypothetical protein FRZ03_11505 [Streptomyces misionensis]|uniref:Uncharacterized protein n=1 Tax=Streptomyces misionensis TaxID=67331 RepID=A0A5C6JVK0_9ACTN|nr:hypothetical protein [Streptomyces misionensis]TWV51996.1 hypothetical protein FRZ03_11505 [Streptomyces misionensis]
MTEHDNPLFDEPQHPQPRIELPAQSEHDLEALSITRRPQPLPEVPATAALRKVATRLEKNSRTNLDEDARKAAAALQVEPERAALLVTAQPNGVSLLSEVAVPGGTLDVIECRAWARMLFPLYQPRIAAMSLSVPAPRLLDDQDEHGHPLAQARCEFSSPKELAELVRETVRSTLNTPKSDYSDSIMQRGVSEPLLVILVRVTFTDGSPSRVLPIVVDGISRLSSVAKTRTNRTNEGTADAVVEDLLRDPNSLRRAVRDEVITYNAAHQRGLTDQVVRVGQAATVPVRLVVGAHNGNTLEVAQ